MWLGVRYDATHDMGDRPLPPTYKSAWPHTVGQDMMSRGTARLMTSIEGPSYMAPIVAPCFISYSLSFFASPATQASRTSAMLRIKAARPMSDQFSAGFHTFPGSFIRQCSLPLEGLSRNEPRQPERPIVKSGGCGASQRSMPSTDETVRELRGRVLPNEKCFFN